MYIPTNKWPTTPFARNMKLLAQLLVNQTSVETFEGFRMSSLNTVSRLSEAAEVLTTVGEGRPFETYTPVKEELIWSIGCDDALKDEIYKAERSLLFHAGKEDKTEVARGVSRLLVLEERVRSKYKATLERLIVECVRLIPANALSDNEKKAARRSNDEKLSRVISAYLSHLVSLGYSRQYISYAAKTHFFKSDIVKARAARIETFFRQFDNEDYRFNVFVCMNEETADYLKAVADGDVVDLSTLNKNVRKIIKECEKHVAGKTITLSFRVKSRDMFSAALRVYEDIYRLIAAAVLGSWGIDIDISRELCVTTMGHGLAISYTTTSDDISLSRRVANSGKISVNRAVKSSLTLLESLKSAEAASRERILNAFTTCYAAVQSQNPEIQLISLWSAFEAMLRPPPATATSRIAHYAKMIAPCVNRSYPSRSFIYASNSAVRLERRNYAKFIASMKSDGVEFDDHFAVLLSGACLPKYSHRYNELIDDCSGSPILTFILQSCQKKFGRPSEHFDTLNSHEMKVNWQLSRIYRARNQIVHAGHTPSYAESLAINAYEYLTTAVFNISRVMAQGSSLSNLDSAVELIVMEYASNKSLVEKMKGGNSFSEDNLFRMFSSKV